MRTFNLKKCLKEISGGKNRGKYTSTFTDYDKGVNSGLDFAIEIIKSNIQEKPEIDTLEGMLKKHEKKSYTCCDETCFCWDVRTYLNKKEMLK